MLIEIGLIEDSILIAHEIVRLAESQHVQAEIITQGLYCYVCLNCNVDGLRIAA